MNPYEVLGVRRNASLKAIKAAFRVKAKAAHPDGGGSAETFNALHRAWKILSNPDKRRQYDATGRVDESEADNAAAFVATIIAQAFDVAVQKGADPTKRDMVAVMRSLVKDQVASLKGELAAVDRGMKVLVKLLGRFRRKDGAPSMIDALVAGKLAEHERAKASMEARKKVLLGALDVLDAHEFEFDMQSVLTTSAFGVGTTASFFSMRVE